MESVGEAYNKVRDDKYYKEANKRLLKSGAPLMIGFGFMGAVAGAFQNDTPVIFIGLIFIVAWTYILLAHKPKIGTKEEEARILEAENELDTTYRKYGSRRGRMMLNTLFGTSISQHIIAFSIILVCVTLAIFFLLSIILVLIKLL